MVSDREPASIRFFGTKILRRKAVELYPGSPETKALLDALWAALSCSQGVGLAAPQIGVAGRAFVIRAGSRSGAPKRIDLVNPVLKKAYGPREDFEEGCLSFPGLYFNVKRTRGAEIVYHDAEGRLRRLKDEGLLARIALHELDHLDGILFTDRISSWRRFWLGPRLLWLAITGFLAGRRNG